MLNLSKIKAQLHRLSSNLPTIESLFATESQHFEQMHVKTSFLTFDYSKNLVTTETLSLLLQLAQSVGLQRAITALFTGEKINHSENRAALHTALRDPQNNTGYPQALVEPINNTLGQMSFLCDALQHQKMRGFSGQPLKHIINIGIGGSFLGTKMVQAALKYYKTCALSQHHLTNIDPAEWADLLTQIDLESSLFIIASKSFTTLETLHNAELVRQALLSKGCSEVDIGKHFIAISSNVAAALRFGIKKEAIFPVNDWVGGRYSLWSAIGLPIALSIGMENYKDLLAGAHALDMHFKKAPLNENMPVIAALIDHWYRNYCSVQTRAVIAYDYGLRFLSEYLQQLEMESNGKSVCQDGTPVGTPTGAILWGGVGTNGQHAYHQLLLQGTTWVPVDFIMPLVSPYEEADGHKQLIANCIAQSRALMHGRSAQEVQTLLAQAGYDARHIKHLTAHMVVPGNRPSNSLIVEQVTPFTLGALLAFYEHRVFVQAQLLGINPYDQFGVELGKQLGREVYEALNGGLDISHLDQSTQFLIAAYRKAHP